MPEYVGIRVLKAKAGEIVRNVCQGMRYVISLRGKPVALIIPLEPVAEPAKEDAWDALYRAASQLDWITPHTTAELLDEVRG